MRTVRLGTFVKPGLVLLTLTVAFSAVTVIGAWVLVDTQRFLAAASTAEGRVVDVVKVVRRERRGSGSRSSSVDRTYYHPVVQFTTARGQVVRFQSDDGDTKPAYEVEDLVQVLYDPANPQDARLDTLWSRWGQPVLLLGLGSFGLAVCWLVRRVTGVTGEPAA